MGMPDPSQLPLQQYSHQTPVVVRQDPQREPLHHVIDWTIALFGPGMVLLAIVVGGLQLIRLKWKERLKRWLT